MRGEFVYMKSLCPPLHTNFDIRPYLVYTFIEFSHLMLISIESVSQIKYARKLNFSLWTEIKYFLVKVFTKMTPAVIFLLDFAFKNISSI